MEFVSETMAAGINRGSSRRLVTVIAAAAVVISYTVAVASLERKRERSAPMATVAVGQALQRVMTKDLKSDRLNGLEREKISEELANMVCDDQVNSATSLWIARHPQDNVWLRCAAERSAGEPYGRALFNQTSRSQLR